jgi:hypothetical protein
MTFQEDGCFPEMGGVDVFDMFDVRLQMASP